METDIVKTYKDELLPAKTPPIFDSEVAEFQAYLNGNDEFDPNEVLVRFRSEFDRWIHSSTLNKVEGLEAFPHRHFCAGELGFFDDLYVRYGAKIRYFKGEHGYHRSLGVGQEIVDIKELQPGDPLILSHPFTEDGGDYPDLEKILQFCDQNKVEVHIDSSMYGTVRDFYFDFNRPCIQSVCFSLSKALSVSHNLTGIRYSRTEVPGPITVTSEYNMGTAHFMWMGIRLMERFGPDFLQNKYHSIYSMLCREMDLSPCRAIQVAKGKDPTSQSMRSCGLAPLLRKIEERQAIESKKRTEKQQSAPNLETSFATEEIEYKSADGMRAIVPFNPQWKKVLALVSGGLDSSLMLYLVAKTFKDQGASTEIIPVNFDIPIKVGIRKSARGVVETVQKLTDYPHLRDIVEFDIPREHSVSPQKVAFIDSHVQKLVRSEGIQFNYNGVTSNPPATVRKNFSDDLFRDVERDLRVSIYNGNDSASPLGFLNKKGVVFLFNHLGILQDLTSQSCSCDANVDWLEQHNLEAPCGQCWWCQERAWGFSSNGLTDPSLDPKMNN